MGQGTTHAALELGFKLSFGFVEPGFPIAAALGGAIAGQPPIVHDIVGNNERFCIPAQLCPGAGQFFLAVRGAVGAACARLCWGAIADGCFAGDERWFDGFFGFKQRSFNGCGVVPVNAQRVPAAGFKAFDLVGGIRDRNLAINGDAIVVPHDDELVELEVPGKGNRFLGNAFQKAAIACQHIGIMVNQIGTKFCRQFGLGNGHAHAIGNALTQRAGGCFNACCVPKLGVTGGF